MIALLKALSYVQLLIALYNKNAIVGTFFFKKKNIHPEAFFYT
jgi:hypothetical protein